MNISLIAAVLAAILILSGQNTKTTGPNCSFVGEVLAAEQYLLSVFAFHDFNGNGNPDPEELPTKGIRISTTGLFGVTGPDGRCDLGYLPEGRYDLAVEDPSDKFRYILSSVSEVIPIGDGLEIAINRDTQVLVPLGVGFLTLPFHKGRKYEIGTYVDLDPTSKRVRDWRGKKRAKDGHFGVDYSARRKTPVCAVAPGVVIQAENGYPDKPITKNPWFDIKDAGNYIIIDHGNGFMSVYAHLSRIAVSPRKLLPDPTDLVLQKVRRGEVIGFVGSTGYSEGPHLHLQIQKYVSRGHRRGGGFAIDPYRDRSYDSSIAWKTCSLCFSNSLSLWTRDNRPSSPQ